MQARRSYRVLSEGERHGGRSPGVVVCVGYFSGVPRLGEGRGRLQGVPGYLSVDGVLALHGGRGELGRGGQGGGVLWFTHQFTLGVLITIMELFQHFGIEFKFY